MPVPSVTPDAVLSLDASYTHPGKTGTTLIFFKGRQFFCWDVASERMLDGYPRETARHWPGLLESSPGNDLRGALYVPSWGPRVHFFFTGQPEAMVWDLARHAPGERRIAANELLPSRITDGDFTPVFAQFPDGKGVVYAFRGNEYTRWSVGARPPQAQDQGFPRQIGPDWKDGLVLEPRAGVYVDWPNRSRAHSNRKIYFFMGNLYLRWDVPSNTRNYRLDIVTGWKGWPKLA